MEPEITREMIALEAIKEGSRVLLLDEEELLLIAESETNLLEAIDNLVRWDLIDAGLISGLKETIAAIQARKARFEVRKIARRALIEQAMTILQQKTLRRPAATLTLADRAPAVVIDNEEEIPAQFFDEKTELVLAKDRIREALEANQEVPGAHMSNGSVTLTVRTR